MANQVMTLQMARERYARSLSLALAPGHDIMRLATILTAHRLPDTSHIPLQLSYSNGKASGKLKIAPKWIVTPSTALFDELETLLGSRAGINLVSNGLQFLLLLPTLRKATGRFDSELLR